MDDKSIHQAGYEIKNVWGSNLESIKYDYLFT